MRIIWWILPIFYISRKIISLVCPVITNWVLKHRQFEIEGVGGKKNPTQTRTQREQNIPPTKKKPPNPRTTQRNNPPKTKNPPKDKTTTTPPQIKSKPTKPHHHQKHSKNPSMLTQNKIQHPNPHKRWKCLRTSFLPWSLEYPHVKLTNYKEKKSFDEEQ